MNQTIKLAERFGAHIANTRPQGVEALHDMLHNDGGHFRYLMAVWMEKNDVKARNAQKTTMDVLLHMNPGYWE
jgi:hypothetical protein